MKEGKKGGRGGVEASVSAEGGLVKGEIRDEMPPSIEKRHRKKGLRPARRTRVAT